MDRIVVRISNLARKVRRSWHRFWYTRLVRGSVAECGPGLRVNGPSEVFGGRSVKLGTNVHFNGVSITGAGGLTIGDNFHSGRELRIITVNHRWKGATSLPYDSEVEAREVVIGDNVWLGDRVTVLPGAVIGEGAIVGAGAVVSGEIAPLVVAAGVPAKPVGERDREHYDRLKAEGRFH